MVYPTRGALVEAKFNTRVGRQAMLMLTYRGQPVPFGAMASLPQDDAQSATIVGDGGMVYLTGAPQRGELKVQWGTQAGQQCRVRYDLGARPTAAAGDKTAPAVNIVQQTLRCEPLGA
ncbi:Outer membrane usher protein FimD precursor [compost metagenome]